MSSARRAFSTSSPTSARSTPGSARSISGSSMERPGPTRRKSSNLLGSLSRVNTNTSSNDRNFGSFDHDSGSSDFGQSMHSHAMPGSALLPNVNSTLPFTQESTRQAISKRLQTWNYLRSLHSTELHYFNSVKLSRAEIDAYYQPNSSGSSSSPPNSAASAGPNELYISPAALQKRATRFMVLGISLGPLLDILNPQDFLKALLTTANDYDQLSDENMGRPRMKSMFRAGKSTRARSNTTTAHAIDPSQFGDEPSSLHWPNIPFDLDYYQTFYSLCDIFIEIYGKMLSFLAPAPPLSPSSAHSPTSNQSSFPSQPSSFLSASAGIGSLGPASIDMVGKIDTKLKKITTLLIKELDGIARHSIRDELANLEASLELGID